MICADCITAAEQRHKDDELVDELLEDPGAGNASTEQLLVDRSDQKAALMMSRQAYEREKAKPVRNPDRESILFARMSGLQSGLAVVDTELSDRVDDALDGIEGES